MLKETMKRIIKSVTLLLLAICVFSITTHALYGFNLTVYAGGTPTNSPLAQKTTNGPAYVRVERLYYYDTTTDEAYIRVRQANGQYATEYMVLRPTVPLTYMLSYAYVTNPVNQYYSLYANMYSSVTNGHIIVQGKWNP